MSNGQESWDLVIKPKPRLINFGIRELWSYRDLILLFIKRDIVAMYKQTILGPLWLFLQPAISTVFFTVVFGGFAKFDTKSIPYPVYVLSGLTLYNFFSTTFTKTSNVFVSNASIFGKVYFPRLTVPISSLLSNTITFLVQLLLLFGLLSYYSIFNGYHWQLNIKAALLVPPTLLMCGMLSMGFGLVTSSLTTKYRDLSFLSGFIMQFLMYFSAVVFPLHSENSRVQLLINLNPIVHMVELFRCAAIHSPLPSLPWLIYSFTCAIFVMLTGMLVFNRVEKSFMDTV